jgi:hypothetical protein
MTPQHAKLFMNAMKENISKFEAQFGEIAPDKDHGMFPGFSGNPKVN